LVCSLAAKRARILAMASKVVVAGLWATIHLDNEIGHLTARERSKIFDALMFSRRRRPVMKAKLFLRLTGEKKESDSIDFKKQSLSTTKCVS